MLGGNQKAWIIISVIFGVTCSLSFLATFVVSKEDVVKEEKEEKSTATLGDINEADRRSFEELDLKIRNERLFLDPNFSRDILLQLTPVGKNRISSLLQTFTGENFNGYINSLRLEYSLSLLKKFNHYTIEAIAMDSGFNNVRTYQRLFRDKYGMTPAEYKKSLQAER